MADHQRDISLSEEDLVKYALVFFGASFAESAIPYPLNSILFPILATVWFAQSGRELPGFSRFYRIAKAVGAGPINSVRNFIVEKGFTYVSNQDRWLRIKPSSDIADPEIETVFATSNDIEKPPNHKEHPLQQLDEYEIKVPDTLDECFEDSDDK